MKRKLTKLVGPVTDNPQEDAFYERAEAAIETPEEAKLPLPSAAGYARGLATEIADHLFRNGGGYEAKRLILDMDGMNGGGWCKSAVVDRVTEIIEAHNEGAKERCL